jgi:hypothetical protein
LAYRIVAKFKSLNIDANHAGTWERCEFAIGRIEAGDVKIVIVKLLVVRIIEFSQRLGLVVLERGHSVVEHRSGFLCCPKLLGIGQRSAQ